CAIRSPRLFRVLPAQPEYLLQSPDTKQVPFTQVLRNFTALGQGWVDLQPQMELRVENAYYALGAPKRGLAGFLGTEVGRYQVRPKGDLKLLAVESHLEQRPGDQPPVQQLLGSAQSSFRRHRFFYAVVFNKRADVRGSVLLSAKSNQELE